MRNYKAAPMGLLDQSQFFYPQLKQRATIKSSLRDFLNEYGLHPRLLSNWRSKSALSFEWAADLALRNLHSLSANIEVKYLDSTSITRKVGYRARIINPRYRSYRTLRNLRSLFANITVQYLDTTSITRKVGCRARIINPRYRSYRAAELALRTLRSRFANFAVNYLT